MAILVDRSSRILIQGITGSTGRTCAQRMIRHGTPLVGGVTPGKGGEVVEGVPVFDTMREAVSRTGANAVLSALPTDRALDGVYEAVEAGIRLLVLYCENVPLHDAIRMRAFAIARGTRLLGPNSAGVISPEKANLSDLNDVNVPAGHVGIVSKSGTLTYEVIDSLKARGLGVSSVVCLGGDRVIGTTYTDVLPLFDNDDETDAVVLIGEPGGTLEYAAAAMAKTMRKPVIAYVTAQHAPPEKRLGHAGAIGSIAGAPAGAAEKLRAFREAGCETAALLTDVAPAVARVVSSIGG
jgi:succinyl-CoA synthetase alpha subunit